MNSNNTLVVKRVQVRYLHVLGMQSYKICTYNIDMESKAKNKFESKLLRNDTYAWDCLGVGLQSHR